MKARRTLFILGLAAAVLVLEAGAGPAGAEKQSYKARVLKTGFPNNITVKIEVTGVSTPEEVAGLQDALANGEGAFRKAFHRTVKGSLMFYGIEQPSVKFHAAFETPTERGRTLTLFSDNRIVLSGPGQAVMGLLFLVVVLELDAEGNGEGRLYENAYIKFTPDGRLDIESYRTAPAQLIQVRRAK
jgi:hypothetical protein